jgi:hypothetical protein
VDLRPLPWPYNAQAQELIGKPLIGKEIYKERLFLSTGLTKVVMAASASCAHLCTKLSTACSLSESPL